MDGVGDGAGGGAAGGGGVTADGGGANAGGSGSSSGGGACARTERDSIDAAASAMNVSGRTQAWRGSYGRDSIRGGQP